MSEEFITKSQDPNINLADIASNNRTEYQQYLSNIIERQIQELNDLDNNLFDYEDDISNLILTDVLSYVHNNYIPIMSLDIAINDPSTVSRVGRYVYELFVVELLNYIIPEVLLSMDLKDPVELTNVSYDGIKSAMQMIAVTRLNSIKELYVKSGNRATYEELLKWTFYMDLFDSNLEDFIERVVMVLVNQYNTKIFSKLITV